MNNTVFISSTYIDLIPHRKKVWEVLKSFKLKVKGMEIFGARTAKPLDTCLREVAASDIFIGIIGMRFGSIDRKSEKSFTQLEYEHALSMGKEIFIYLINEEEAQVTPAQIDGENFYKLRSFKSKLSQNHTLDTFVDEEELGRKMFKKLKGFLPKENTELNFRPKEMEAFVERVRLNKEIYNVIIGTHLGVPREIYASKEDNDFFVIPAQIKSGLIIKSERIEGTYDFQFKDKEGYRTTIECVFKLDAGIILSLVTQLMKIDLSLDTILDVLDGIKSNVTSEEQFILVAIHQALTKVYKKVDQIL